VDGIVNTTCCFQIFFYICFQTIFFDFFWVFSKTFSIKVLFFVVGLPVFKLTFFFQNVIESFFCLQFAVHDSFFFMIVFTFFFLTDTIGGKE